MIQKAILIDHIDATHIFDGLEDFPTHVVHMRDGAFVDVPLQWPDQVFGSSLHRLALTWLKEDRAVRQAAESAGIKAKRGPKTGEVSLLSETVHLLISIGSYRFGNVLQKV